MAVMVLEAAAALLPSLALALLWRRREAALRAELDALAGRLHEVSARLEATEHDLAAARSSTGVAEGMLLEKGIADEDELEAMRRRLGGEAGPRAGDDAIH